MNFRPSLRSPTQCLVATAMIGWLLLTIESGCAGDRTTPAINVYDGFETPGLSGLWSRDRFEPGAVISETEIVRAGNRALMVTVHARDKFEAGINGNLDSERAELLEASRLVSKEGGNYEHAFSMYLPPDFPIVPTRLVIAQWKQSCPAGGNCADDSPVLAIRYSSGVLRITQTLNRRRTILFEEKAEFRGRWLDFRFQVRFSQHQDGRIKAWLGDRQLVDYAGITANAEDALTGYPDPSRFYFKMGLYRDVMAEPMTLYIDEYRKRELPDAAPGRAASAP
ncbi:MAG TPA: polysaccharide lyase [Opitutaceae bacterium]|nr:polysaccharide lyase [Opitutaceae bacterium]